MTDPIVPSRRPVGIFALILCAVILLAAAPLYEDYAVNLAARYLQATSADADPIIWGALTFQRAALRDPNTLVVFGSSENLCACGLPYLASYYYRTGPVGFSVYSVGTGTMSDLIFAQILAALGEDLRGKKIVLSTPWEWFSGLPGMPTDAYASRFRPEIADAFAFDASLPLDLREDIARRMLDYPQPLQAEPVLRVALRALASKTAAGTAEYYALYPIGRVDSYVLRVQDAWNTANFITRHPSLHPNSPRRPAALDWPALLADANRRAVDQSPNNPFGFWKDYYQAHLSDLDYTKAVGRYCAMPRVDVPSAARASSVRPIILRSAAWGDLTLAMRVTRYYGADALAITYPLPGSYWDFGGSLSAPDRARYYDQFEATGAQNAIPTITLRAFDEDRLFLAEPLSHVSPRGAVVVDRLFERFWHGSSPAQIDAALAELSQRVPASPLPTPSTWFCQ